MTDAAYAPAHITGFFAIEPDPDPIKAGSIGCGMCLETGVKARITVDPSISKSAIMFNNIQIDFPTVEYVIETLLGHKHSPINIHLTSVVPLGFGFGISGAASLASALVINNTFGLKKSIEQIAAVAHSAEVVNRTGMGDVTGQYAGGVVIRTAPGAPGIGKIMRIPAIKEEISWICFDAMSTATILSDRVVVNKISKIGKRALKALVKRPNIKNFMSVSKEFAIETELISSRALEAVEAVEASGGMASMAMLGDTVFALGDSSALKEFGQVSSGRIGLYGVHLL